MRGQKVNGSQGHVLLQALVLTWHLVNNISYTVLQPLAAKSILRETASQGKFMQVCVLPGNSSNIKDAGKKYPNALP